MIHTLAVVSSPPIGLVAFIVYAMVSKFAGRSSSQSLLPERVCRSRGRTAISFSVIRVIHFTLCHLLAALWWRVVAHRGNFFMYLDRSIKPPRWSSEWNFG